ncbi:MAG: hypothetical protein Q8P67_02635 [archaeon]|nr:hypothetical protein [archaeon]
MAGLHSGAVYCVEYTGKEGHLLSGGEDRSVRLTNGRTGLRVASYEGFHSNDVRAVCASAEGRLVASGGADRRVCVVDAATGALIRKPYSRHKSTVSSVAFAPQAAGGDGLLLSGGADHAAYLWDVRQRGGRPVQGLEGASDSVAAVASTRDALLTASYDGRLRVYDVRCGVMHTDAIKRPLAPLTSMRVIHAPSARSASQSQSHVLLSSLDAAVSLWNVTDGVLVDEYRGHAHSSLLLSSAPVGGPSPRFVVSGSERPEACLWLFARPSVAPLKIPATTSRASLTTVAGDPWRESFVMATLDGHLEVWNWFDH